MAKRSSRANRQIRRNITGWLDKGRPESTGAAADAVLHVLAALVAVLLPLSLVALAAGMVFRAPDLMAFEIDRSGVLQEAGLQLAPEEVAAEVSDYLRHKKETLELTTQVARQDVPVFSFMDEVNLDRIRALLDKALYPSVGGLAFAVILFAVVRVAKRMRYLKYAMRASAALYACAVCFTMALALCAPLREMVFSRQPGVEFADGELLPRLFGGLYPILSGSMTCLISFIIYITLYSVSRRFTVEKETIFG